MHEHCIFYKFSNEIAAEFPLSEMTHTNKD